MAKKKWWQRENKKKRGHTPSKAEKRQQNYNKPKGNSMTIDKDNKVTPIAAGRELTDAEFAALQAEHDKGGAFKTVTVARQNCWDAGIEILKSCDKVTVPKYHISFDLLSHQKINKLKEFYPRLEWLAYLVGTVDHENAKVVVEDLVIPDSQQVTTASVYNVEYEWGVLPDGKQIIGVIHSHHTMGAFFSGTDDAYINQNHDVSIVVATAKGREIKSQIRVKVPCGAYVLAEDITYSVNYPQVLDEAEFEASFKDKIKTYTPVVTYVNSGYNYLGNYSGGYSGRRGMSSGFAGNTYGGRGMGNPPRGQQMDLYEGYDTSVWDDLEDEYPNPFDMSAYQVRQELLTYYSEEEVNEFMVGGLNYAQNELYVVQQMCMEGIDVKNTGTDGTEWVYDEDTDENNDTNAQNGLGQVAMGVALRDQTDEPFAGEDVWSTGEPEIEFEDDLADTPLYKRLNTQLEAEGLFQNMSNDERDKIIREAILETEDQVAQG